MDSGQNHECWGPGESQKQLQKWVQSQGVLFTLVNTSGGPFRPRGCQGRSLHPSLLPRDRLVGVRSAAVVGCRNDGPDCPGVPFGSL